MTTNVYQRLIDLLEAARCPYRALEHAETFTSADSAAVRGEPLESGAKALLMKAGDGYVLAVMRAHRKLDSRAFQRVTGARKLRFATREELAEVTGGLMPGSVPPFGTPLFNVPLYVDSSITAGTRVAFNAGAPNRSLFLATADYLAVSRPIVANFTLP